MAVGQGTMVKRAILAIWLGLWCLAASFANAAEPDWKLLKLRSDLNDLSARLEQEESLRAAPISAMVKDLGWSRTLYSEKYSFIRPSAVQPAEIGWTDIRPALARLSQVYGGKDDFDVLAAQRPGSTEAIRIAAGTVTLDQLRQHLTHRHMSRDIATGTDILRVPIVIAKGASLRLTDDEVLMLSRPDGAFIANFGRLEIFDAEVSATADANERNEEFNPFIVTAGSGTVNVSGATFGHLGFGTTEKYSGFSILAYPSMYPDGRSLISGSRFQDLVTVTVVGVASVEIRDSKLLEMRRLPLLISRARHTQVIGNLFAGDSPTNAIRVIQGSDGSQIIGNILLEGSRAGMLVASGSDNVEIRSNLIWRRNGGGVKLLDVACGRVERNLILDDRQKGIEVRASRDIFVHANSIIGNKNAGVWVSGQAPGQVTYVVGNTMRENGSGIATATAALITMQGNDLSRQLPRLIDGDITQHFRAIVGDLHGTSPLVLSSGGAEPATRLSPAGCS